MRLTPQEQSAIASAAHATLLAGTRVSLFGSRVDDHARGGDIDLLLETPLTLPAAELVARRQAFVARLYRLIGERRIDVVVAGPASSADPAVVASARRYAVPLVQT
jgi:hypothetical protein